MRIDTPGSRFVEGLDPTVSYAVLERHVPDAIRGYRSEAELRYLVGAGVSAAAVYHLRDALNGAGFDKVKIVASSGFDPAKCRVMAEAKAPIDVIGTGSFLPQRWTETYATADIVEYDGKPLVKVGREFLLAQIGRRRSKSHGALRLEEDPTLGPRRAARSAAPGAARRHAAGGLPRLDRARCRRPVIGELRPGRSLHRTRRP